MEHTYQAVYEGLDSYTMACIIHEIQVSRDFEYGEWSHIQLKEEGIVIGYIGDDSVELVDVENSESSKHHSSFLEICNRGLWAGRLADLCSGVHTN